jgi:hypothetical protein
MFAAPIEGTLKNFVEFGDTDVACHEQTPPYQRGTRRDVSRRQERHAHGDQECNGSLRRGVPLHLRACLHRRGKFCSHRCYVASRQAFSKALADGRLEGILAPERKRAKAERLQLLQETAWL